ncbi:paramyosin, short form-like [Pectinophora gossypiella]|uniref:paramyosin, short form-like n=1 Tax=Pectinophora gossypiella TaxID=13191 RepID=UPI00214F1E95|nr:paramyosin, short form-like [Pectinophora gossypiella]
MAPVKVPNYCKWNRPPTAVYEDNYGYGINFYQPMIDYISAKERGVSSKPPHLPWNNERGLEKYRFDKPVRAYSNEDLTRIAREVSEQAKKDLNKYNISKRAPITVVATAAAANVTKHVGVESVTVKAKKKKVEREAIKAERQKKRMDEIEKELQQYEREANVGAELRGKAMMYRGKSAKAIAQTLLQETRKNCAEGQMRKMDLHARKALIDRSLARSTENLISSMMSESRISNISKMSESKFSESLSEAVRSIREVSPRRCIVTVETEYPAIQETYMQTLSDLKETLKQFDRLNTRLLIDTRYKSTPHK